MPPLPDDFCSPLLCYHSLPSAAEAAARAQGLGMITTGATMAVLAALALQGTCGASVGAAKGIGVLAGVAAGWAVQGTCGASVASAHPISMPSFNFAGGVGAHPTCAQRPRRYY
jgi:hypothetical protein